MVRVVILALLTVVLNAGCSRTEVDTTALERLHTQVEDRFHACRQMVELRRYDLAKLQGDREVLAQQIRVAREEGDAAKAQLADIRRVHQLNDQDQPIDGRVAARGLELGDVQIRSMVFSHAVVTAWDGNLLTFRYQDGVARVVIADTLPPIQELMRNAKPTEPLQPPLVINRSDLTEYLASNVSKPRPPTKKAPARSTASIRRRH